ncbi:MAG: hypothetical protein ACFFCW_29155 [Candidatus Hodarchaeota archaeon]
MVLRKLLGLLILLIFCSAFLEAAGDLTLEPRMPEKEIQITQTEKPPVIDGEIGEEEWQDAWKIRSYFTDRFSGKKFGEPSEIYLVQSGNVLYVAFKYFEGDPSKILAKMTKDQTDITTDDCFGMVVDMYHNHGDIGWFCLNPLGTKMWRIFGGTAEKVEWAGNWQGAAKIMDEGWQGELSVDLSKIPHPANMTTIGINFDRRQQYNNYLGDLFNVGKIGHSIHDIDKERMGDLKLYPVEAVALTASIMPYFYAGAEKDYVENEWDFADREGVDIKVPFASTMNAVVSAFSDEEHVENEVEAIDFDYAASRYIADRRPFWQEGAGFRETYGAFHSGTISRTHLGGSVFGKPTKGSSTAAFFSYNNDDGTVGILSGGYGRAKTGGGITAVYHTGRDTGLIHGGMGTSAGKDGWFSTGGNITILRNSQEDVVGERYLQHITFQIKNWTGKTVPYYTSEDYLNPVGYEGFIGIYGARSYSWLTFKHEDQGLWGRFIKESSVGVTNNTGDFTNGDLYRRTFGANYEVTTRSDMYLNVYLSGGKYAEFTDGTIEFDFRGRKSDPKTNFGCLLETGRRQEEAMAYLAPYGSLSYKGLTGSLKVAKLWHTEDSNLYILTFAYDITPEIGIYGRMIDRNGERNAYMGFRKSGYVGTVIHLILGGPNRVESQDTWMQQRVVFKVTRSFDFTRG